MPARSHFRTPPALLRPPNHRSLLAVNHHRPIVIARRAHGGSVVTRGNSGVANEAGQLQPHATTNRTQLHRQINGPQNRTTAESSHVSVTLPQEGQTAGRCM